MAWVDERGEIIDSEQAGYLTRIRINELHRLIAAHPGCTITIIPTIGDYVRTGRPIARIAGCPVDPHLMRDVRHALPVEEQRDIGCDAAYSVDHLVNIAWTALSTAKSNPAVGVAACQTLSDIVHQWASEGAPPQASDAPIRYHDGTMRTLLDGMESLVVVASESMQHQSLATIIDALAVAFPLASRDDQDHIEQILLTSLPALGDHLPTRVLGSAMENAQRALTESGRADAAGQLEAAWQVLAGQRGVIKSRGNRDQA